MTKKPGFRSLADAVADAATVVAIGLAFAAALIYPILKSILAG